MERLARVLVTDASAQPDEEQATAAGIEAVSLTALLGAPPSAADLPRLAEEQNAAAIITGTRLRFDRTVLTALRQAGVRGLVTASVGYDHIDLAAAQDADITVCNVPDYGTDEVADHALALLLWCLRQLRTAQPPAWEGEQASRLAAWWALPHYAGVSRLRGRTLALLGFGRIGQAVARRAQTFGLDVRWYDPAVPRGQDKATGTTRVESVRDLLVGADALSIHCLLNDRTAGLVGAAELALLPRQAVVVNTARGPVLDEAALLAALRAGSLAAAALDVLVQEPPTDSVLVQAYLQGAVPSLLITPHMAWYSREGVAELRRKAAAEAGRLLRGEPPWNGL